MDHPTRPPKPETANQGLGLGLAYLVCIDAVLGTNLHSGGGHDSEDYCKREGICWQSERDPAGQVGHDGVESVLEATCQLLAPEKPRRTYNENEDGAGYMDGKFDRGLEWEEWVGQGVEKSEDMRQKGGHVALTVLCEYLIVIEDPGNNPLMSGA